MELAIIGGLGLLGYRLAARGAAFRDATSVPPPLPITNEYPFHPQTQVDAMLERDNDQAAAHVGSIMTFQRSSTPYVTSDRKQVYNESQAARRMETFTGTDTAGFQSRVERTPAFAPAERRERVDASGTVRPAVDLDEARRALEDRASMLSAHNNVAPMERQQVGPGLGVDPSVPATDGFHPMFRALPVEDLQVHRLNNLPGRAPSGAAPIPRAQTTMGLMHKKGTDLSGETAPVMAPRSTSFSAPQRTPHVAARRTRGEVDGFDGVHAGPVASMRSGTYMPPGTMVRRPIDDPAMLTRSGGGGDSAGGAVPVVPGGHATVRGSYANEPSGVRGTGRGHESYVPGGPGFAQGGTYPEEAPHRAADRETPLSSSVSVSGARSAVSYGSRGAKSWEVRGGDRRQHGTPMDAGAAAATVRAPSCKGKFYVGADSSLDARVGNLKGPGAGTVRHRDPKTTLRSVTASTPNLEGSRPGSAWRRRDDAVVMRADERELTDGRVATGGSNLFSGPSSAGAGTRAPPGRQNATTAMSHGAMPLVAARVDPTDVAPRNKLTVDNPRAPF